MKGGPRPRGARGVVSKPRQLPHNSPAGVNSIAEGDTVISPYLMEIRFIRGGAHPSQFLLGGEGGRLGGS